MQRQLIEQEKHASLGNLVAGVAHEINTPLGNSLMALSQLTYVAESLQKDLALGKLTRSQLATSTDEITESVSLLSSNVHRAVELVRSFKQLAADQSDTHVAHINLHDLIENVFASFHNQYKNRPIECHNQVDSDIRFLGSPAIFTQIVTNLFDNGLRHAFVVADGEAPRKGKIGFSAELVGNQLTLTYRDNGQGIDENLINRVFEPLQTSNRGKSKGLGLTIIDKLVREDLNGTLTCQNTQPSGLQFSLVCDVVVDQSSVA
jgi:signal transduction histidine kinase